MGDWMLLVFRGRYVKLDGCLLAVLLPDSYFCGFPHFEHKRCRWLQFGAVNPNENVAGLDSGFIRGPAFVNVFEPPFLVSVDREPPYGCVHRQSCGNVPGTPVEETRVAGF